MEKKLTPQFWKEYFKYYDYLNYLPTYQELLDKILKELDPKEGEIILDAGVGTGNLAVLIKEKGSKAIDRYSHLLFSDEIEDFFVHFLKRKIFFINNKDVITFHNIWLYNLDIKAKSILHYKKMSNLIYFLSLV